MASWTLSILLVVPLAALALLLVWGVRVVSHKIDLILEPADTPPEPFFDDSKLWAALERLEVAVAQGIEHVDKKSKRIDGVIAAAKRRFEAEGYVDPGLEAEADVLPLFHEEGGGGEGVPSLPDGLDAFPSQGIPGSIPPGWGAGA